MGKKSETILNPDFNCKWLKTREGIFIKTSFIVEIFTGLTDDGMEALMCKTVIDCKYHSLHTIGLFGSKEEATIMLNNFIEKSNEVQNK